MWMLPHNCSWTCSVCRRLLPPCGWNTPSTCECAHCYTYASSYYYSYHNRKRHSWICETKNRYSKPVMALNLKDPGLPEYIKCIWNLNACIYPSFLWFDNLMAFHYQPLWYCIKSLYKLSVTVLGCGEKKRY